jgi:DNA ligase (NAD+)
MKESIDNLVNIIQLASEAYYNGENAIMSDAEFDSYVDKLRKIDPENPVLFSIGQDSGSVFKKCKHIIKMGSQNKTTNHEEFETWARNNLRDEYIVEYKCDGSSIELQYENGKFIKAVTRGNGDIGDDVTCNIVKARGLVKELKASNFSGAVRGEVLLFHDVFKEHCKNKANCRNAANGIMKRKDSDEANLLSIVVYDVLNRDTSDPDCFKTEYDKIKWLREQGFKVVDVFYMSDIDDISKFRDELSVSRFDDIEYDIDGLVIKCPEVDQEDARRNRPNKQIAYKFILSEQPTVVRDIEWYANGKTRTPVAVCDPVFLCGTTVKKANLCNINLITKMGLKIGSTVMMVKRGEIIPKIERVISTPKDAKEIKFPEYCEFCTSKLVVKPTTIYCPNIHCPNTEIRRLIKWASVNKIYGLGSALCTSLYSSGVIHTIKDLYSTKIEELSKVMSPKIASKIIEQINKTRKMTLPKFIAGYDLDGIGETVVETIERSLNPSSLEEFLDLKYYPISMIQGFGPNSAKQIVDELHNNRKELKELNAVIEIEFKANKVESGNWFIGKTVCFTGPLNTMTRDMAEKLVKDGGGKCSSSVTKNTDFLVTNEASSSSKYLAAINLGVKIINEKEFIELSKGGY